MNPTTTTPGHSLTIETPIWSDYLRGGFGDLVAQCSCGAHEYVYSRVEGAYWHELHRSQLHAHPSYLLLHFPMPEGWMQAPNAPDEAAPAHSAGARDYQCPACAGSGSVAAYGARGGRFYHFGERSTCPECAGSGRSEKWVA